MPANNNIELSVEGYYFIVVYCFVFLSFFIVTINNRGIVFYANGISLYLLFFAIALFYVPVAPSISLALRELVAMSYPILVYFILVGNSRNIDPVAVLYKVLMGLLVFSTLSVSIEIASGGFSEAWAQRGQIGFTNKQYMYSLDPVAVAMVLFISLSKIFENKRHLNDYVIAFLSVLNIGAAFSRSYFLAVLVSIFVFWGLKSKTRGAFTLKIFIAVTILGLVLLTDNFISSSFIKPNVDLTATSVLDSGDLSSLPIDSSGRFLYWAWAFDKVQYYRGELGMWFGLGLGSSKWLMSESPWVDQTSIHGDYARLLVEFGIVGVIMYLSSMFYLIAHFSNKYSEAIDATLRRNAALIIMILIYMLAIGVTYEALNKYRIIFIVMFSSVASSYIHKRFGYAGYTKTTSPNG